MDRTNEKFNFNTSLYISPVSYTHLFHTLSILLFSFYFAVTKIGLYSSVYLALLHGCFLSERIAVLNSKSRGVLIVKVRGTRFALGRNITKNILVG